MKPTSQGSMSIMVLTIGLVIGTAIGGLVILSSSQYGFSQRDVASEHALAIAEAGIQYYRWHLSHNPDDYWDGTGGQPGPYVHAYKDPQGTVVGSFELEVIPPEVGYSNVTIISTGWTESQPYIKRTVTASLGLPSLAQYSFIHNANIWFGSGLTVHGQALSNGGIRQDGINDSILSSAKESYTCGSETGCSPTQNRPGIWGDGGPSELWDFPVPPVDFDSITVDLNELRSAAQSEGVYFDTGDDGYQVIFRDDGSADVYEITRLQQYRGYDSTTGCENLYQRIQRKNLLGNYALEDYNLFFFEDTVWVEGTVNGRATIVAARFPTSTYNEDIWILDSIQYLDQSGDHSLGLIAQEDIYFGRNLPQDFTIHAALLAQTGRIIRHYYGAWWCGGSTSYAVRDSLEIYGSVISNQKSYWNWGSEPLSGFQTRDVTYDEHLYLLPPPFFPTAGDYEFISWDEGRPE